jgi:predicted short-subunit dehydrogenase-like oxidoreductase (DUF2520 family)
LNKTIIRRIVIVGTGRLAGHLIVSLKKAGFTIVQVVGRNHEKTQSFAEKYEIDFVTSLDLIERKADLYMLAVSDDAVVEVIEKLPELNGVCMHSSGSINLHVFEKKFTSFGVFYPLQTFTEDRFIDFRKVPILIEANQPSVQKLLNSVAVSLSDMVYNVNSSDRRQLHLAAVFVSNFVNVLFSIGNDLLETTKLPFEILRPLILETVNKAFESGPEKAQTGPARRGDYKTMQMHLGLLENRPEFANIYTLLSNSIIMKFNQPKDE